MRKTLSAMLLIMAAMSVCVTAFAEDENDGWDTASSAIVMTATPDSVTLKNIGTAPFNAGSLEIVINGTLDVVGRISDSAMIKPDPFMFVDSGRTDTQLTVPISTVPSGSTLILTNGFGCYAKCVVT